MTSNQASKQNEQPSTNESKVFVTNSEIPVIINGMSADAIPKVIAEVSVPSQPIYLKVDVPTDYTAAVITPIVVGIAAVLITLLNHRNAIKSTEKLQSLQLTNSQELQNLQLRSTEKLLKLQLRSATANFRHAWSTDFRTFCAEYIGSVTQLYLRAYDNPKFLDSSDANEILGVKVTATASIKMMLDKSKAYTVEISAIMAEIDRELESLHLNEGKTLMPILRKFIDKAQEVREVAWRDIKSDLSHS